MMRIILLLLLTLTGPFCIFTQASPTVPPSSLEMTSEQTSRSAPTVIKQTEETSPAVASTQAPVLDTTEQLTVMTKGVPAASTNAQVTQTESAAPTAATESPKAGTEEKNDTQTTAGAATDHVVESGVLMDNINETESEPVDIENEGMGTGQVVGIVIGALIGVIVVIAIIILVVRRMGQYSP
ncbi:uncharacterized protein si:ch211-156j16.1 isoform X2 [Danio aesculapii]|nr:uncharacterized protein si:ch211-156j16.1 isoform X2 [Danio aesculapii]